MIIGYTKTMESAYGRLHVMLLRANERMNELMN